MVIIGSDVPRITARHIREAFAALGSNDFVFGPAPDGGYWLIGCKNTRKNPQSLFQNTRWSTQYALEDTKVSLGLVRIAQVAVLQDVDTLDDLNGLAKI